MFFPALVIGSALGNFVFVLYKDYLYASTDWYMLTDQHQDEYVIESDRYQLIAILGLMSVFSGLIRAPISSVVIVYEMTNVGKTRADFILPSLVTCMVAHMVSTEIQEEDL